VKEYVEFKVVYKKKPYDVKFPLDDTISALKSQIEKLTGEPLIGDFNHFARCSCEKSAMHSVIFHSQV
jgi:hypothetical protein